MKKMVLVIVALAMFCALPVSSVSAQATQQQTFLIGVKPLADSSSWSMKSINFFILSSQGMDWWSFFGPSYKCGDNFVDLLACLTFPDGTEGTYGVSPRVRFCFGRFYTWADLELYPGVKQYYTEAKLQWRAQKSVGPGEGLEFGVTGRAFTVDSRWEAPLLWSVGPNIQYRISDRMGLSLTWQYYLSKLGDDFVRLKTLFFF